ncbi:hypothetical protein ILUMI_18544, partial [Ignelater luminosus]
MAWWHLVHLTRSGIISTSAPSDGPGPSTKTKRYTVYSNHWKNNPDYSKWIQKKDDYTATCKLCQADISIKKDSNEENDISKVELMCVFHNVTRGISYNSLDCQVRLAHAVYSDSIIAAKMFCGRTKAAAVARNVLAPYAQEQVVTQLKDAQYFSVGSDASNVGNIKTYPYAVQYFNTETGISKKVLDFYEDPFESSKDIFRKIKEVTEENDLKLTYECQKDIWEFVSKSLTHFDNSEEIDECKHEEVSEGYLYFVHNVISEFQVAILALESDACTVLEIDSEMRKLMSHLKNRLDDKFFG